jgi:hypothetical protein
MHSVYRLLELVAASRRKPLYDFSYSRHRREINIHFANIGAHLQSNQGYATNSPTPVAIGYVWGRAQEEFNFRIWVERIMSEVPV